MASNSTSFQYLNHDWETQLTMLKVIYDTEQIHVKYYDDENEEISLNNQEDYNSALQFSVSCVNCFLKMVLRDHKGSVVGKPSFKVDINDEDIKKIINKDVAVVSSSTENKEQVLQTDILANLSNEKKNWLVNYLDQLKKDIVSEMEVKIKDLVLTQSTVFLSNNNFINEEEEINVRKNSDTDVFTMGNEMQFEDRIKKLISLLSEARLSERPIKIAFLEEELQLSGALNAVFVKDLTMPDGTKCLPNMKFQKKWLIKNTGKLAWSTESFPVKLVCIAGNIATQNAEFVSVEQTDVDNTTIISVDLIAPTISGDFFSEWVLICNNYQFGPRIWASIEVVEINDNPLDASSFKNSTTSDDLEDEFVVVPDCFDLNKNWKSKCNETTNNVNNEFDASYFDIKPDEPKIESENQQIDQVLNSLNIQTDISQLNSFNKNDLIKKETVEKVETVESSLKQIMSEPVSIISNQSEKINQPLKSPSSFSAFNLVKDALALSNDALSNLQMPAYVGNITINENEESVKPLNNEKISNSSVASIAHASKSISNAFGSLGSVYQTGHLRIENEKPMDKLISMGFANRALNNQLLKKYNNDLDKIVSELLEQQESNYR